MYVARIEEWVARLGDRLDAVVVYGSPYVAESLFLGLPGSVTTVFSYGQMPMGQTLALEWLFGKIQTDMTPHFAKDVTPAQKAEFAAEMKTLRASAKAGKLKLDKTQAFLKLATEADSDEKIDSAEADKLIAAVRDVNRGVK